MLLARFQFIADTSCPSNRILFPGKTSTARSPKFLLYELAERTVFSREFGLAGFFADDGSFKVPSNGRIDRESIGPTDVT